MIFTLVVLLSLVPLIQGRGSILSSCTKSERGDSELDQVDYANEKIYIYLYAPIAFAVNIRPHGSDDIALRLKGNCKTGKIKAFKLVRGKNWIDLAANKIPPLKCDRDPILIFVNIKRKEVVIKDIKIDLKSPLKSLVTSRQGHVGKVEIKEGQSILIGAGDNCIEFPPPISGCNEAAAWYRQHQRCYDQHNGKGGLNLNGFLACYSGPECDSEGGFNPVQPMGSVYFSCVERSGRLLSGPTRINDVPEHDAATYCNKISEKLKA